MKKRILITAGPTVEYIDPVRGITNISTGKTGSFIADALSKRFNTTLLISKNSRYFPKSKKVKIIYFDTFKALNLKIKKELFSKNYDAVIHLAAVSDYVPHILITKTGKKINLPSKKKISLNDNFYIIFKKNFKIIERLKGYSKNKNVKIIAFKLTSKASEKEIKTAIKKIKTKWVIHNDTSDISDRKHCFNVWRGGKKIKRLKDIFELANFVKKIILEEK